MPWPIGFSVGSARGELPVNGSAGLAATAVTGMLKRIVSALSLCTDYAMGCEPGEAAPVDPFSLSKPIFSDSR